ncbi:MAG: alanyl-tRNA editing protein [Candidatus Asgardarchaeia archaeon]
MTEKIYLRDSYVKSCAAKILNIKKRENALLEVVLDRTIFHPKSSGQIADEGTIENEHFKGSVVNVIENDNEIIHLIKPIIGDIQLGEIVNCKLLWDKRYAIMRAHTAEHLLARAFYNVLGDTKIKGVFLEEDEGYLIVSNLDKKRIWEQISLAEEQVNNVILEGHDIKIKFFSSLDEAMSHYGNSLRSRLDEESSVNEIRIIEIEDFDYTACTGTHVKNTSEVKFVKVTNIERYDKVSYKLKFITGDKALRRVIKLANMLLELSRDLSTGEEYVKETIENLIFQNKDLRKQLSKITERYIKLWVNENINKENKLLVEETFNFADVGIAIKILNKQEILEKEITWLLKIKQPKPTILIMSKKVKDIKFDDMLGKLKNISADIGGVKKDTFIMINLKDEKNLEKIANSIKKEVEKTIIQP